MNQSVSDPSAVWTHSPADGSRLEFWTYPTEHGIRDAKGRRVGGYAAIALYPADSGNPTRSRDYFYLTIRATRDGQTYGAWPRGTGFQRLSDAQAVGLIKLEAQRKSYARKYGRGV